MTSIFQIDWIFIDTIIIILLLLLLIGVKIFKTTHRWRKSFSNQALEHKIIIKMHKKYHNPYFLTKKYSLTKNSSLIQQSSILPFILIVRTNYKRKLLRILTEGLTTYGFNVITLNVKIRRKPDNIEIDKKMNNAWISFISTLINLITKEEQIINSSYILLNHSRSPISYSTIISDSNNMGTILINPKLYRQNSKNYHNVIKELSSNPQIYTIFSRKSILYLKNRHLEKYLKNESNEKTESFNFLIIKKAKYSFKYYETIVLGMVIDIIENELLKSEI